MPAEGSRCACVMKTCGSGMTRSGQRPMSSATPSSFTRKYDSWPARERPSIVRRSVRSVKRSASRMTRKAIIAPMKQRTLMIAALVLLVAAVFSGVATHPFIGFDDPEYVTKNAIVTRGLTLDGIRYAFTTLKPYYWQPLTWLSLMLDCTLWGVKAGPILIENALLHAIAALLLFLTFAKATKNDWRSFALAAIWAIHPLRVESVAWVAERKDVLSTMFLIPAMPP